MRKLLIYLLLSTFVNLVGFAQSTIIMPGGTTESIKTSGANNGFNISGLTNQERNAIQNPAKGYLIFNTTANCLEVFNGSNWFNLCGTENLPPFSSFTYSSTNFQVTFNNTTQRGYSYFWNFGNGQTSISVTPSITYTNAGSYTVTLTATNAYGSNTSSQVISVTSVPPNPNPNTVADIDGNIYKTVTIGTQVWMKENLNVTRYRNGDIIPNVIGDLTWINLNSGAWSRYNNDLSTTNEFKVGLLYNFFAAQDPRGVCPAGWRVPLDSDFQLLTAFIGGASAGGKLKEANGINSLWNSPNLQATNETGFTGLPGGKRIGNDIRFGNKGDFTEVFVTGAFWTQTNAIGGGSIAFSLFSSSDGILRSGELKTWGMSIRCIKE